ncbi:MAG: bifunctional phosphoribosyl-AMP cyclohydrolase/phosphoribosyl-ATP diphosphatase HisIE [Chitinophagaceae bacterium]|nr:bifunctional phosphoribosyl-AMP cyclohydrolase/phosphoribosyl-ATP diphosphatase HisIE [Chitinophagaceae bacterium]MDB5223617.1 bifunctional phosphoribosyl-AMP cyclohydrolase/phosphoribosyl-ATP diphosphatase HisIE [Chitinophagaceae bacterium]
MNGKPDFSKYADGLMPAIIQDATTNVVLMLGFMNEDAWGKTKETKLVTFYSRTKQRLWTKGEESKNYLHLIDIKLDCDNDTFLIKARPDGPVCHTGSDTCFNEENISENFLSQLEKIIADRKENPNEKSYTSSLFTKGINAVAQKVGEEAVELIIEAKDDDAGEFKNEAADLLFHYLVLLRAKGFALNDVTDILKQRHAK